MAEGRILPPSFWLDEISGSLTPRASLEGEQHADVAIVGAGYTGLWTAYYLASKRPQLRISLIESEIAGFGASGRNGGWCTPHLSGIASWIAGPKREQALSLQRAMFDAVDEVGRVADREGIHCDYAKGGFLNVATNEPECRRSRELLDEAHRQGFTDEDYRWLDASESERKVRIAGARGAVYSPHGASLQPAKLARGLAETVERLGVALYEHSPARSVDPGEVVTDRGRLHAGVVLVCTEGYTQHLKQVRRRLLPLHSMMIATEPLPDGLWQEIGAADRVLFGDVRRILCYAQRTADGRIALGAGGRYLYGSGVVRYFPPEGPDYALAERVLVELFPRLQGVRISHRWGGAFGVPRDWKPFVRFDGSSGIGAAGGYVGNGVAAANLAGRTLADLVTGESTERTGHPWVQHLSPRWEIEPLRWIAVSTMLRIGATADEREKLGRPAGLRGAVFDAAARH